MISSNTTVLISPLNWGLGHASRCIPLINFLIDQGCIVVVCGNGESLKLLKDEFPELHYELLPKYSIRYSKNPRWFALKMLLHLPRFFNSIRKDFAATKLICKKHKPQLIISDNRYGFRNPEITSILITHQTKPLLPKSIRAFSNLVWKRLEKKMNVFDEVWIPDFEFEPNLSGILSHNNSNLKKGIYIGPLSRFSKIDTTNTQNSILAIASGPEPHRSEFEKMVLVLAEKTDLHFTLLQGKPGRTNNSQSKNLVCYNHLNTKELKTLFERCSVVLTRSGYSSIMDMAAMLKKAILIPTPGQSEQNYLIEHLVNHELFSVYNPKTDDFLKIYKEINNRHIQNSNLDNTNALLHIKNTLIQFSE